jgi:GDPmannose 4,6-dehydratase
MPIALITGISGQDGSYLTELLLSKGYVVHGTVRRSSSIERHRLEHLISNPAMYEKTLFLHYADLNDTTTLRRLISSIQPDEFYHLAGQSHVGLSFEIPESTCDLAAMGTLRILEILRDLARPPKFLNMGSSELFGHAKLSPQDEGTPFRPISPYGVAKAFSVEMTRVYRDSFGIFGCNAIAYNHESPRRGEGFVTRKIARAVARIACGRPEKLTLGNLDIQRDWGYAPEYVEGMWRILQADNPEDFILASGKATLLKDFLSFAFEQVGLDWREWTQVDARYVRPVDPSSLVGDATKAAKLLDWRVQTDARQLAAIMVAAELDVLRT